MTDHRLHMAAVALFFSSWLVGCASTGDAPGREALKLGDESLVMLEECEIDLDRVKASRPPKAKVLVKHYDYEDASGDLVGVEFEINIPKSYGNGHPKRMVKLADSEGKSPDGNTPNQGPMLLSPSDKNSTYVRLFKAGGVPYILVATGEKNDSTKVNWGSNKKETQATKGTYVEDSSGQEVPSEDYEGVERTRKRIDPNSGSAASVETITVDMLGWKIGFQIYQY